MPHSCRVQGVILEGQWHFEVQVNPGNTELPAAQFTEKGVRDAADRG